MARKNILQTIALKQATHLMDILAKLEDLKNKFGAKRIEEELLKLRKDKQ
jgi:hypothetical protein|tara:strand:- start:803 stop:952 length:150 start_codon:yes stop_codon:yes gene_type:complete